MFQSIFYNLLKIRLRKLEDNQKLYEKKDF